MIVNIKLNVTIGAGSEALKNMQEELGYDPSVHGPFSDFVVMQITEGIKKLNDQKPLEDSTFIRLNAVEVNEL